MPAFDAAGLLREHLPGISEKTLSELLAMLEDRGKPASRPLQTLMQQGFSSTLIQAALIEYRDARLAESGSLTESALRAIRQTDRQMLLLMQAVSRDCRERVEELDSRLSVAGNELLLSKARGRWSREGEITLYNYFNEVPVMARCVFRDVPDADAAVEYANDLVPVVSAGQHGRFVHVRLPGVQSCLRLEVAVREGRLVYLKYAGIFKTAQERRQHIRVLCDGVAHATLHAPEGVGFEAQLRDLSQNGLGLVVRSVRVKVRDRLEFECNLSGSTLSGDCTVRWVGDAQGGQFGVELDASLAVVRRLGQEVARRQKHVMSSLRIRGVPDALL